MRVGMPWHALCLWGGAPLPYRMMPATATQHVLSPLISRAAFFNLRDDLGENRPGSTEVWQEIDITKGRGCSPDLVHANAHHGTLFAFFYV
jgi:hypothetical protein